MERLKKVLAYILCSFFLSVNCVQGGLVGTLPTEQHRVSGELYIVDSKTIFIEDFNYDGGGPGAFLYFYRPGERVSSSGDGTIIPLPPSAGQGDSDRYPGAFQRRSFNNEDIMVTLPDGVDACDIGTITVWCQPFRAIFTRLEIPRKTFLNNGADPCAVANPGGPNDPGPEFDNCKVLDDTLQLSWRVDNDNSQVRFRLCGCTANDASTIQYLGFGFSGSNVRTSMFQADATIAWVDSNGMAQAQDYYLSSYVQCRGGSGACPDTVDTTTGSTCTNDVTDVSGFVQEGQQCISFTRPFNPSDSTCDKPIDPTNQNQYIVWGIGSLGATAFKHHSRATSSDKPLHLGRDALDECRDVKLTCQLCDPFPTSTLTAKGDATFVAVIGPSANPRGYTAISGQAGWGIAWYINNTLIPELVVERGRTYTFLVYGGNVSTDASNYHPFYITDSVNGGRLLNTPQERTAETVYAGFDGSDKAVTVGALCEYTENSAAETIRQTCGTYDDYFSTLNSTCRAGEPGRLVWKPNNKTPDLVYYQCAAHLNLGWRIHVIDPDPLPTTPPSPTTIADGKTTTPPHMPSTKAQTMATELFTTSSADDVISTNDDVISTTMSTTIVQEVLPGTTKAPPTSESKPTEFLTTSKPAPPTSTETDHDIDSTTGESVTTEVDMMTTTVPEVPPQSTELPVSSEAPTTATPSGTPVAFPDSSDNGNLPSSTDHDSVPEDETVTMTTSEELPEGTMTSSADGGAIDGATSQVADVSTGGVGATSGEVDNQTANVDQVMIGGSLSVSSSFSFIGILIIVATMTFF